jgi:hypothetical protein
VEVTHLWQLISELGKPLGASVKKMSGRFYAAIMLWMMELKIYKHTELSRHYVEFYDVLEALVKKTLYKRQTLDKIYSNTSRTTLVEGLQKLWDEKSLLLVDDQAYMGNIEEIRYYYGVKNKNRNFLFKHTRTHLPFLVWVILSITRTLKKAVQQRKGTSGRRGSRFTHCSPEQLPPEYRNLANADPNPNPNPNPNENENENDDDNDNSLEGDYEDEEEEKGKEEEKCKDGPQDDVGEAKLEGSLAQMKKVDARGTPKSRSLAGMQANSEACETIRYDEQFVVINDNITPRAFLSRTFSQ